MSLVGSLEDLSLPDILQIVNLSRRTGMLAITEQFGCNHWIKFQSGNITDVVSEKADPDLLKFLLGRGLLTSEECTQVAAAASEGKGVLAVSLELGLLNQILANQICREYVSLRIKQLARLTTGDFSFFLQDAVDSGASQPPPSETGLEEPINPHNLRYDQLDWDDSELPDTAAAPAAAPAPDVQPAAEAPAEESESEPEPEPEPEPAGSVQYIGPEDAGTSTLPAGMGGGLVPPASEEPEPSTEPAIQEPEQPVESPAPSPEADSPATPAPVFMGRRTLALLLLDDEDLYRNILKVKIEENGYAVEAVANVKDALERARKLRSMNVDFIPVLDLVLPTLDGTGFLGGLEFLRELRGDGDLPPTIMLLEPPEPELRSQLEALEVKAWKAKPTIESMQLAQMDTVLDRLAQEIIAEVEELRVQEDQEAADFFRDLGVERTTTGGYKVRDQLSLLKGLMGELQNPTESSEISLLVLRLASEYLERGVLYLVRGETLSGLGGYGQTGSGQMMTQQVARHQVELQPGSQLYKTIKEGQTFFGALEEHAGDLDLQKAMGTYNPMEVAYIPMLSRGRTIALLCGDNAVSGNPIGQIQGLEIFISQAGMAMENALLQRQLRQMKRELNTGD